MSVAVFKLGGSLLDLPNLAECVGTVIDQFSSSSPLLVVGGGSAADLVRDWDGRHGLGEEAAHWLALKSLILTESLVEARIPQAARISSPEEAKPIWEAGGWPIVCLHNFVRNHETEFGSSLPHRWEVTSDSLSAFVATQWPAEALVLLKSVDLPSGLDADGAGERGFVDGYFPQAVSATMPIYWCNLKGEQKELLICLNGLN